MRFTREELEEALDITTVATGDAELDRLVADAVRKFLDPHLEARRDALEKLWDAWERVKTLLPAADKKESVKLLLDRGATDPTLRDEQCRDEE